MLGSSLTKGIIANLRCEVHHHDFDPRCKGEEIRYQISIYDEAVMGQLYKEENLFLTRKEAEEEAGRRTKLLFEGNPVDTDL